MAARLAALLAALAILPATAAGGGSGSTAQPNVQVLAPLAIRALDRQRTVRVYLPPGYDTGDRRYPVVYMHDGQNLFDKATAFAGEWAVDEALNRLASEHGLELIVVGIDHGGEHRIRELIPFDHDKYGAAEGNAYLDFVVGQLKPHIDRHYRTLPGRRHTAIMGSSLGGLISHYALLRHPRVFSRAGVFSPAYWIAPDLFPLAGATQLPDDSRLYLLLGDEEGAEMAADFTRMRNLLEDTVSTGRWQAKRVPGAGHNEAFWRSEFAHAIRWLFADSQPDRSTAAE